MIIETTKSVQYGTQLPTSNFKIASSPKAFKILSDSLYKNKIRAVVRELACNALDAHTLVNQKAPFDIAAPTELYPVFVIRDYGPGLSDEDMTELYTTYFASTKSTSNDFIGALGLGSKSPFSYTNVFTTTSYFNGVETSFIASIDGDEPTLKLAYKKETSEPNGLKIQVSVKPSDIFRFKEESERILASFPEGSYNHITDMECLRFNLDSEVNKITDPFLIDMLPSRINAVYGNIIYPIDLSLINMRHILDIGVSFIADGYYVIKFELGELDIAPSREELSYNENTIQTLRDKLDACEVKLMNAYMDEMRDISNPRELYRRASLLSRRQQERIYEADDTILDAWNEMVKNLHTDIPVLAVYNKEGKRLVDKCKTVFNTPSINNVVVIVKDVSRSVAEVVRHPLFMRRFDYPTVAIVDGKLDNLAEVTKQIQENMLDDVVFVKSSQLDDYRSNKPTTNKKSPNCIRISESGERTSLTLSASDIDKLSGYAMCSYRDSITSIVENVKLSPTRAPVIQTISRFASCLNTPVYIFKGRVISRVRKNKNLIPFEYAIRDYIQEQIDKDANIYDPRDSLSWSQQRMLSNIADFGDEQILDHVHKLLLCNDVVIDEDIAYVVKHAHVYFSHNLVTNATHFRDKFDITKHTALKNFDRFIDDNLLFLRCCDIIDLDSHSTEKQIQLRKQITSLAVLK